MPEIFYETVHFSGRVQGVGFRYSTMQVAKEFEVSGYVSNLADGRVQMEAEGTEADVRAFVQAVEDRMHGFVRKVERQNGRRERKFLGFAIK